MFGSPVEQAVLVELGVWTGLSSVDSGDATGDSLTGGGTGVLPTGDEVGLTGSVIGVDIGLATGVATGGVTGEATGDSMVVVTGFDTAAGAFVIGVDT